MKRLNKNFTKSVERFNTNVQNNSNSFYQVITWVLFSFTIILLIIILFNKLNNKIL